ncbi:MAG: hypothetical protein QOI61_1323 [Actinomycetota bacterium]
MTPFTSDIPPLEVRKTDDPRVVAEAATEDYSLHVVPRSWRLTPVRLLMAWSSLATAVAWLYFAALVAMLVGTTAAIIGLLVSVVVYSLVAYFINRGAAQSGLTVALFSRSIFGFLGSSIVSLLFAATAIYYFVFEGSIVAVAAKSFFDRHGVVLDIKLWYLIVVLYTIPLVIKGVRVWLDRLNGFLLPFYLVGMVAIVAWVTAHAGYSGDWASYSPPAALVQGPGWLFVVNTYMGIFVFFMYQMEFARLGRTKDLRLSSGVTFGPVFFFFTFFVNGLIGIYIASELHIRQLAEGQLVVSLVSVTGLVGLIFAVVTQSRINTANLYASSTSLQSFASRVLRVDAPRVVWVFVAAAVGYLIMLTNVFSFILDALNYQGIAIVGWVAMVVVRVVWLRTPNALSRLEFRPGRVPAFNPAALVIWALTTTGGVLLKVFDGAFFATYGLPIVFAAAAILYAIAITSMPERWLLHSRPHDPLLEVDDPWEDRVRCHGCDRFYLAREMDRDPTAGHLAICSACASNIAFARGAAAEAATARRDASVIATAHAGADGSDG